MVKIIVGLAIGCVGKFPDELRRHGTVWAGWCLIRAGCGNRDKCKSIDIGVEIYIKCNAMVSVAWLGLRLRPPHFRF